MATTIDRANWEDNKPRGPKVVCLCGSTKFKDEFFREQARLTFEGVIVLSVGWFGHADGMPKDADKAALDELHLRKIDLADEVLIINPGGYIGDSTRNEIMYALIHGKQLSALESFPIEIDEKITMVPRAPISVQMIEPTEQRVIIQPMKQRDGDQPLPVQNNTPAIQDLVIVDIERRKKLGVERYGTLLQVFNGRNTMQDAYEEALDKAIYLRQVLEEWNSLRAFLRSLVESGVVIPDEQLQAFLGGKK